MPELMMIFYEVGWLEAINLLTLLRLNASVPHTRISQFLDLYVN
jgi:hypothetical protein